MQKKVHDTKKDDINKNKNRKYQILINKQIQVIYIPIQKKYFFTITNIKKYLHRHRHYDHHLNVFVHIVHWILLHHP
jgi:hypothetical protein